MSNTIQSGLFVDAFFAILAGPFIKVVVTLTKKELAPLPTMASASSIDGAIQKNMRGRGVGRTEKGTTLVISNEDWNEI